MKFIGTNEALASKSDRKESTNSTNSGEDHDDEFTEALDSLDLDELFDELIDDDTGSSTSSKGDFKKIPNIFQRIFFREINKFSTPQ